MEFHSEMNKLAVRMHAAITIKQEDDEPPEAHLDLKLEDGRGQVVVATAEDHDGRDYLRLTTKVGDAAQYPAEKYKHLLQLNAGLLRGAFALSEGDLVLTDVVDAHPLDHERASRAILQLARSADQMEKALFGTDRS